MALGLITLAALIVTVPLFLILGTVVVRGLGALNWAFLTQIPKPIGEEGGGMGNAIVGSLLLLGFASMIGVPLGIGAGVFLAEYGRNKFGNVVRFTADALNGVPSVVIGMTAWALVVVPQKHFSLLAGSVALGIMMIPVISRTTEEVLLAGSTVHPRSRSWPGHSQVADDSFCRVAHRQRRHCHQRHAGLRAHRR